MILFRMCILACGFFSVISCSNDVGRVKVDVTEQERPQLEGQHLIDAFKPVGGQFLYSERQVYRDLFEGNVFQSQSLPFGNGNKPSRNAVEASQAIAGSWYSYGFNHPGATGGTEYINFEIRSDGKLIVKSAGLTNGPDGPTRENPCPYTLHLTGESRDGFLVYANPERMTDSMIKCLGSKPWGGVVVRLVDDEVLYVDSRIRGVSVAQKQYVAKRHQWW